MLVACDLCLVEGDVAWKVLARTMFPKFRTLRLYLMLLRFTDEYVHETYFGPEIFSSYSCESNKGKLFIVRERHSLPTECPQLVVRVL